MRFQNLFTRVKPSYGDLQRTNQPHELRTLTLINVIREEIDGHTNEQTAKKTTTLEWIIVQVCMAIMHVSLQGN